MTVGPRLFTVGHGSRSMEELLRLLEHCGVRLVVDVRSNPASVRYSWLDRHALKQSLADAEIGYRWMRELGGRRPSSEQDNRHTGLSTAQQRAFATALHSPKVKIALEEVVGLAHSTSVCLMCAEPEPTSCHRHLLADALTLAGLEVVHLIDVDEERLHILNENIELIDDHIVYRQRQLALL